MPYPAKTVTFTNGRVISLQILTPPRVLMQWILDMRKHVPPEGRASARPESCALARPFWL